MNKLNTTANDPKMQEAIKYWVQTIEANIPVDLDKTAKEYGALQRKRGVRNASELLRMILIYATSTMSIKVLSLAAAALKISIISDTAWQKRITASVAWTAYLLNIVLSNVVQPVGDKPYKNRKVYLIDGSCFRQDGKAGLIYRAHMSYCLNTGCMNQVEVTDAHTAESLTIYTIEKNAIYIADAGYGKATQIGYVISKNANVIFRITPNNITLYDENCEKINMAELLKASNRSAIEIQCFIKYDKQLLPIRIVASRLPEDKIEAAINRKKRKSQKNQSKIKPETLIYAEWVILATSLDNSYTKEEILTIYRSRWQVELLFKRIKQNFKINTIKAASSKYALAIIQLWLLAWAITEKQVFEFEKLIIKKRLDLQRVSVWSLCQFFHTKTVSIINAQWSLLVNTSDVELLTKFLCNHKGSRINQYSDLTLCDFALNLA